MYPFGDPPDYEPDPSSAPRPPGGGHRHLRGRAGPRCPAGRRRAGLPVPAFANYVDGNLDQARDMLDPPQRRPRPVRRRRPRRHDLRRELPDVPARPTGESAGPRGGCRSSGWSSARPGPPPARSASPTGASSLPGWKADLNVIDLDRLTLHRPRSSTGTSRPAASASSRRPTATATRSSPGVEIHARRQADREPPRPARPLSALVRLPSTGSGPTCRGPRPGYRGRPPARVTAGSASRRGRRGGAGPPSRRGAWAARRRRPGRPRTG